MKNLIFTAIWVLIVSSSCKTQTTDIVKNDTIMEKFNASDYKDLKIDKKTGLYITDDGFLLQLIESGNEIGTIIKKQQIDSPYNEFYEYGINNLLKVKGSLIYMTKIGIWKEFNESGELIKETNWDEPYKYSLNMVIDKIKNDYKVDLEKISQGGGLSRSLRQQLDNKPIYEVTLKSAENPIQRKYILIDGLNGKILFEDFYFTKGGSNETPFAHYLETLKENKNTSSIYKTFQGKDYTRKEWEDIEKEMYKDYKKKNT